MIFKTAYNTAFKSRSYFSGEYELLQMAQFSSLEQMTNMSTGFTKLTNMLSGTEAVICGQNC